MPNSVLEILLALTTTPTLSNAFPIDFGTQLDSAVSAAKERKIIWDILRFIATNFIAHAFTVSTAPGYGGAYSLLFSLASLAFPYIGLVTACRSIEQFPILERDALQRAAKAGALCMVARTKYWKGRNGESNVWCWQKDGDPTPLPAGKPKTLHYEGLELEPIPQRYVGIHGICSLPRPADPPTPGAANRGEYIMVRVPADFQVQWRTLRLPIGQSKNIYPSHKKWKNRDKKKRQKKSGAVAVDGGQPKGTGAPREENSNPEGFDGDAGDQEEWMKESSCQISSTYSVPKTAIALVQLFSAVPLIWEARNSENGYAAYQLTLIPYALMSLLNIAKAFFTPTYPMLYMIESETMEEARSRGGRFEGTIGKLCEFSAGEGAPTRDLKGTVGEPKSGSGSQDIQFKPNDKGQIEEHKKQGLLRMIWEALKYIFMHLIWEHVRREIYIARFYWRKPGRMLESNVRRIFNNARENSSIMVSPFGCPILRKRRCRDIVMTCIADFLLSISLIVPYLATHFITGYTSGKSTVFQRALFMMWLVFGQVSHFFQRMFWGYLQTRVVPLGTQWLWAVLAFGMIFGAMFALVPAGGILMVATLYRDHLLEEARASSSSAAAVSLAASIISTASVGATALTSATASISATASVGATALTSATASISATATSTAGLLA